MWATITGLILVRESSAAAHVCVTVLLTDTLDRGGDALPTLHVLKVLFLFFFFINVH